MINKIAIIFPSMPDIEFVGAQGNVIKTTRENYGAVISSLAIEDIDEQTIFSLIIQNESFYVVLSPSMEGLCMMFPRITDVEDSDDQYCVDIIFPQWYVSIFGKDIENVSDENVNTFFDTNGLASAVSRYEKRICTTVRRDSRLLYRHSR